MLGVVAVEDRMGQVLRRPGKGFRNVRMRLAGQILERTRERSTREDLDEILDVAQLRGLVEGDGKTRLHAPQVDLPLRRPLQDAARLAGRGLHRERVEVRVVQKREARLSQSRGKELSEVVHARRDLLEALRAVVDRIHAGHHREQDLRGADVRGRLVAADVLFAGLEGEAIAALALRVLRDADETPGDHPAHLVPRGHERCVRPAEAHGHAEALGRTDADVGAHLPRRLIEGEGQEVARKCGDGARRLCLCGDGGEVLDLARGRRVLKEDAEHIRLHPDLARLDHLHGDAEGQGAGLHHRDGLGMDVVRNDEHIPIAPRHRLGHVHGFGRGGAFVEKRSVGERQRGEVRNHGLEIEQRLEATLRDLGLIGRVLRVPAGVLEDVPAHDGRGQTAGVAHADERPPGLVRLRDRGDAIQQLALGEWRGQVQRPAQMDRGRNRLLDEGIERPCAQRLEHRGPVGLGGADVAAGKGIDGREIGELHWVPVLWRRRGR